MMNRLMRIRSGLMGGAGGLSAAASDYTSLDVDDAVIVHKQREIVRLVAEATKNGSYVNSNYDIMIQERQKELDRLVDVKKGRAGSSNSEPGRNKIRELRRLLLS